MGKYNLNIVQIRQNRPRTVKKPYMPQTEGRRRGRPLKEDDGPNDIIQKRHYARNYREKVSTHRILVTKYYLLNF